MLIYSIFGLTSNAIQKHESSSLGSSTEFTPHLPLVSGPVSDNNISIYIALFTTYIVALGAGLVAILYLKDAKLINIFLIALGVLMFLEAAFQMYIFFGDDVAYIQLMTAKAGAKHAFDKLNPMMLRIAFNAVSLFVLFTTLS